MNTTMPGKAKLCLTSLFILNVLFLYCKPTKESNDTAPLLAAYLIDQMANVGNCEGTTGGVADPLLGDQWHLRNTGQLGGTVGEDANVIPVWEGGNNGAGVTVVVVDDGMDIGHEDLTSNVLAGKSYNYLDKGSDPSGATASHGTSVAGVIAARDRNGIGVSGVAPCASLLGYNLLQSYSSANEADAMSRGIADISASNNSWGPPDLRGELAAATTAWKDAVETGLSSGRGGLGAIYTWAAGNGACSTCSVGEVDNSNYDGYANHHGVLSICAVDEFGKRAPYSEKGANLWVCTPSQGDNSTDGITTTDITGDYGYNYAGASGDYPDTNYTKFFNGTSAAAPLAAGVVALTLKANPQLTWRDLRIVLAKSARKNDTTDSDWAQNGASYNINHKYGFGAADATAAVALAKTWVNVGVLVTHETSLNTVGSAIPDANLSGVSDTIAVSSSGIGKIEYVEITFSAADHGSGGDLQVSLLSPSGTTSVLAEKHNCYSSSQSVTPTSCGAHNSWVFGSARHLGESADGNWSLTVKDMASSNTGTFQSWKLKFYGRQ